MENNERPQHGGKREGAGRKLLPPGAKLKRVQVMLKEEQIAKARALGAGNVCKGVRKAIDETELFYP